MPHWDTPYTAQSKHGTCTCTCTPTGTSIFDPTLCESAYTWFAPRPSRAARRDNRPIIVLDPFSGGSVRGIVAAKLGLLYIGIDMSSRQVAAHMRAIPCAPYRASAMHARLYTALQVEANKEQLSVCEDCAYKPEWLVGDGEDAVRLPPSLSPPPFASRSRSPSLPLPLPLPLPSLPLRFPFHAAPV